MSSLEERFPDIPWRVFHRLHREMPRQGPGADECTRRALALVGELPASPVVWDVGCGPGAQTRVLARELATPIRALDILPHLIEELKAHAAEEGLEHLIDARVGDMGEPFAPEGSVDLIWAEGCVYIVGFEWALEHWGRLLSPGGVIVVTEPVWLVDDPPAEAREMWGRRDAGPDERRRQPTPGRGGRLRGPRATSPCLRAPGSTATICRWKSVSTD